MVTSMMANGRKERKMVKVLKTTNTLHFLFVYSYIQGIMYCVNGAKYDGQWKKGMQDG